MELWSTDIYLQFNQLREVS